MKTLRVLLTAMSIWGLAVACAASAPERLTRIFMKTPTTGWALGATPRGDALLRTTDGGRHWRNVSPKSIWPLSPARVQANSDMDGIGDEGIDAYFADGRKGWVALKDLQGWVRVERTRDGGKHWAGTSFADRTGVQLLLSFQNARRGCLLTISDMASGSTRKALYRTRNGGRTWTATTGALPNHIDPAGVRFRSRSEGWLAAGYHGSDEMPFYHTRDGGRRWRLQEMKTPTAHDFRYGVFDAPRFFGRVNKVGVLPVRFVEGPQDETAFYVTRDGGATWQLRCAPALEAYAIVTARHWLGLDRSGTRLYITSSSGHSWNRRRLVQRVGGLGHDTSLEFVTTRTGWALIDGYRVGASTLLQTRDGGRHWRTIYPLTRRRAL